LYDVTVSGTDLTFSHRLPIEKNDKIVLTGVTGSVASISSMANIDGGFTVGSANGVVTITRNDDTDTVAGINRKLTFNADLGSVGGMYIMNNTGTIIREIAARIN
jgi:PKD repeat protein